MRAVTRRGVSVVVSAAAFAVLWIIGRTSRGQGNWAGDEAPAKRPDNDQAVNTDSTSAKEAGHASREASSRAAPRDANARPRLKLLRSLTGTHTRRLLLSGTGLVITGALAAVFGGLALGLFSNPGLPDTTQQILFQPWNINGTGGVLPGIHIASRDRGYCWIHSAVTGRPDAYRCGFGNRVLDPCIADLYESRASEQVICPYPDPRDVTLISLTKALPGSSKASNAPLAPWLLILKNGDRCFAVAGITTSAAGLGEHYTCGKAGVLFGTAVSAFQAWSIFQQRFGHPDIVPTEIAKAYF